MRSQPSPPRSRTRGQCTATGPMPVMISRSGRCPWRTNRRRPSSVSLSAWQLSKLETSASTACARSARAPLRKTSVSGSPKVSGCESWKTLVSVTAYHSFAGEVEASNTPTIRRLTLSRRHQLSPIAQVGEGKTISKYRKDQIVFSQGEVADAVFYIQQGKIKLTVVSEQGKEAVVAILGPGHFFGEGCLYGHPIRFSTTRAVDECMITRLAKATMIATIH